MWGKVFKVAVGAHTAYSFYKNRQRHKENSARFMDRSEEKALFKIDSSTDADGDPSIARTRLPNGPLKLGGG